MNDNRTTDDDRLIEAMARAYAPAPRTAEQRQQFAAVLDRRRQGWTFTWQPIPLFAAAAATLLVLWLAVGSSGPQPTQVADATSARGEVLVALVLDEELEFAGEELPEDLAILAEVIGY
jgi:hypothetical protein